MNRASLRAALDSAGVYRRDYALNDGNDALLRDGAVFVEDRNDYWAVGGFERGTWYLSGRFPDESSACDDAYRRLTRHPATEPFSDAEYEIAAKDAAQRLAPLQAILTPGTAPVPFALETGLVVDRFGADGGRLLHPAGTTFPQRSQPPSELDEALPDYGLRAFRVVRPVEVRAGRVAPWFGQPGGGLMFQLADVSNDIGDLLEDGILVALSPGASSGGGDTMAGGV